jgi:DNA invertase Pin-like site-specific DNA recombinase
MHRNKKECEAIREPRIIGYIRCSSPGQVTDGETLERQREKILEYAKVNDLGAVTFLQDEGCSGFKPNRPGFQKI